ncbi:MAG: ATP-binding cassette domain-containing protein [Candidatus Shapirobacteria bacterium]
MLELRKITKKFGEKIALDGVDLEIGRTGVVGLLGPNGAGKTTLMRIITGFYRASEGEVAWKGEKADTRGVEYKRNLGYLPENNPLYGQMKTREYLEFMAQIKGIAKIEAEVLKVISECGLTEVTGQKIDTLSRGFKQRVGVAGAILGSPKLMVLDEPTTGLDPNQIIEIRQLIKKIAKNKAVILSTHILTEAREICDRIVIISQGRIVLDEETKKIRNLEKRFVELTN